MTKKNPNCQQTTKTKIRKTKRIKYKFIRKNISNKKNCAQTLTTNDTQKKKDNTNCKNLQLNVNIQLIRENINNYSRNLIKNHFINYAKSIFSDSFINESIINKEIITAEILYKYNLTNEHRKCAFKYILNFIKYKNFNIKCYFSTTLMFDLFLINYSKDELNNDCQKFFFSKQSNELSQTKIILFSLCCFFLTSQYYNAKLITIEQLLQFENAKDEVTYDQLIKLVNDIISYIDLNICDINIYYFVEKYMFDILEHLKQLTHNQKFLEDFKNYTIHFSTRIVQNLDTLNILDNIQALGVVIFSFKFSIFTSKETDENLDIYINDWTKKISKLINNYDINGLQNIINWLQLYVSR